MADLRRELVKIIDGIYQRRKNKPTLIYSDKVKGSEIVKSKRR